MDPRAARNWLSDCPDRRSATNRLMGFALAMGFDFVAFLEPKDIDPDKGGTAGQDGHAEKSGATETAEDIPVVWLVRPHRVQTWRVNNPIENWPIAASCVDSQIPFIWRPGDAQYFSPRQVSPRQRVAVKGFMRRFNVSAAITTPVHLAHHGFGFVSWFACGVDEPPVDEWADIAPRLQQVATAFLAAIPEFRGADQSSDEVELSARELECLRWSALGKSAEEIAELIGRSAETARFHLKNAVRKLGANNRVHAIAMASYRHLLGDLSGLPS